MRACMCVCDNEGDPGEREGGETLNLLSFIPTTVKSKNLGISAIEGVGFHRWEREVK